MLRQNAAKTQKDTVNTAMPPAGGIKERKTNMRRYGKTTVNLSRNRDHLVDFS